MTLNELSQELKTMYTNALPNEKVTMIYLFGIKHYKEIKQVGIKDVVEQSGIRLSYQAELNKAVNLGKYVTVK